MALLNPGSCFGERKTPRHLLLQEPCSQVRAPANYWCLALIVILLTCTVILWVDRQ